MSVSFFGLCFLTLPVFGLVWLWWSVFRCSVAKDDLARCGTCNYAVRGIASLTCPECGADLREVGIVMPKGRRMIGPVLFVLLWSLLLGLPVLMIGTLVGRIGPRVISGATSMKLKPNSGFPGGLGGPGNVTLSFSYSGVNARGIGGTSTSTRRSKNSTTSTMTIGGINPSVQFDQIDLELASLGQMTIVPSSLTCSYSVAARPMPQTSSAFNATQMLAWYKACGVDISKPQIIAEAKELVSIVTSLSKGNGSFTARNFTFSGASTSTRTTMTPNSYWLLVLLAGAVVWVTGIWLYLRIRRKRNQSSSIPA